MRNKNALPPYFEPSAKRGYKREKKKDGRESNNSICDIILNFI